MSRAARDSHSDELDEGSSSIARTGHFLFMGVAEQTVRHRSGLPIWYRRAISLPHWFIMTLTVLMPVCRFLKGQSSAVRQVAFALTATTTSAPRRTAAPNAGRFRNLGASFPHPAPCRLQWLLRCHHP